MSAAVTTHRHALHVRIGRELRSFVRRLFRGGRVYAGSCLDDDLWTDLRLEWRIRRTSAEPHFVVQHGPQRTESFRYIGRNRGGLGTGRASESKAYYSMISSARSRSAGGIVSPSRRAVLPLITSSNFVGCSIGKAAGFAPLRILTT